MAIQGLNRILEAREAQMERKPQQVEDNSDVIRLLYEYMKKRFQDQEELLKTILDNQRIIMSKLEDKE